MKQFLGGCTGAFIGVFLGIILLAVLLFAVITQSMDDSLHSKKIEIRDAKINKPVLKLELKGELKEMSRKDWWDFKNMFNDKGLVLSQLVRSIKTAAQDKNIKGLYIKISSFSASLSQREELLKALETFKQSGKWIYVYADTYFQSDYYLASIADTIILHPQGILVWKGLASRITFYKKALEKLDIQVQVFRHGKFKSAVEPFLLEKMSDENRRQIRSLLTSMWDKILGTVSEHRSISRDKLNTFANELTIKDAESALQYQLVDVLADEKTAEQLVLRRVKKDEKQSFVDYHTYRYKALEKYDKGNPDKIAVVYVSGPIVADIEEANSDEVIVPSRFLKMMKKLENNEKIKAVVLRVNSPGGSALASEVIWQAIQRLKSKKPVIVSFGEVAASGGYYISCGADYIFTDHHTITGSIGAFAILPNIQNLMQKNLGLNTDTVKTNMYADFMNIWRPVQPKEYETIMHNIEKVYATFIDRVSQGRKLDKSYIDSIGQGRVWSGADAVKLKLADKVGTLEDAIAYAAQKVHLKKFDVLEYPKSQNPLQQILKSLNSEGEDVQEKFLQKQLGNHYKEVHLLLQTLKNHQISYLSLMPYQITIY